MYSSNVRVMKAMMQYHTCMKHSTKCNNRVQWMLNRLRDTLLPQKYKARFFSIICTCKDGDLSRPFEDPWEDIQSRHLVDTVSFLDNYISHHTDNAQASVIDEMMLHLRRHQIIPTKDNLSLLAETTLTDDESRTSAFKMLFLLQKALEGNYTILDPPRADDQILAKREYSRTFELEGFNHEYLKNLIGARGREILPFMRRHTCYVKFDKVPDGDGFKVKATIKKSSKTPEVLENIQTLLERMVKDCQELEDSYEEDRQEKLEERKQKFTELLKNAGGMGPTADMSTMLNKINSNPEYEDINDEVDFDVQKQWFKDLQENWVEEHHQSPPVSSAVASTAVNSPATSTIASVEETLPKQVVPSLTSQPHSEIQSRAPDSIASPASSFQPQALSPSPVQDQAVASTSGMSGSPAPTLCLVHDRRWMATFQYFLTQCYTQIAMPKKYGYPLSQHICTCVGTCSNPTPDPRIHFELFAITSKQFLTVKTYLKCWPEEQQTIIGPLIRQIEKYDRAETWHSLIKLVYYYVAMKEKAYEKLDVGAELPGERHARLQQAAASITQSSSVIQPRVSSSTAAAAPRVSNMSVTRAPTMPRPEIGSSLGGASHGAVGSVSASVLGLSARGSVPGEVSAGPSVPPGAAGGAGDAQPPKKKLKKLSSGDWIDDCFFHGKKKKFVFQCIMNYLHRYARLPVKLNIPFSMAVCCCGETVELKEFFLVEANCLEHCRFMRGKLESWRGDSKISVQPVVALLDDYINSRNITAGFIKFVFYFKKAFIGDLFEFNEIHDELKRPRA